MTQDLEQQREALEKNIERLKTCRLRPKSRLLKLKEKLEEIAGEHDNDDDHE